MFLEIQAEGIRPEFEKLLYVSQANARGFKFLLADDGDADILSPDGEVFKVSRFKCRCADHVFRNYCFHELWTRQLRPCEMCGYVMELLEHLTCFGATTRLFECASCGNARDLDLVREERRLNVRDSRFTCEGRCKQAIAWLKANQSDWYVWQVVHQSPELVGTMVTTLSDVGEDMLADKIVRQAGYKAA